jgi:cyclophilin family peptidyl-prolyl cis-trans isomerase
MIQHANFVTAALLGVLWALPAAAGPVVGHERVVFNTDAGDIVFAFYPEVAPQTVRQFLRLVSYEVYDHFHFHRLEPGFVLQLAAHHNRTPPLTPEQLKLIHPLNLEPSDIKHRAGVLSLARADANPDSGETSFSILLGDAPHLDGKYTVFGVVERGMDVVHELARVPTHANKEPVVRLEVKKAMVVGSREQLATVSVQPARPVPVPSHYNSSAASSPGVFPMRIEVALVVLVMIAISVGCSLLWNRLPPRVLASLVLMIVLVGGFLLLILFMPLAHSSSTFALGVFLGLLGLFRLMSSFETPPG